MSATLLLEIGVEELPPAAMRTLMNAFADSIVAGLDAAGLEHGTVKRYATPRRLTVSIADTAAFTDAQQVEKAGPTVAIAFADDGKPTAAAEGFARSVGTTVEALARVPSDKGERLVYRGENPGVGLSALLPDVFADTLHHMPIPKRMRWGDSDDAFVRPVHWLVAMHGAQVLPLQAFGITAGNITHGHRFHCTDTIVLDDADDYVTKLRVPGFVLVDVDERQALIQKQLHVRAQELGGSVQIDAGLLDEVTALVEWPVVLSGRFDARFLELPEEVLISTLQGHQRYFPVIGDSGLLNVFITVANIESTDPAQVVAGNERVIRPRLADALFFWTQDRGTGLTRFARGLDRVNFQRDLGSMADKTRRIGVIAAWLADQVGMGERDALHQAAALAKADLLTDMVGEFPELQGIMGGYYARAEGCETAVATAISDHYAPAAASAAIPTSPAGQLLSLADRLDTLAGIFALGKRPSGDKDPFALRRAALGVLRIIIEGKLTLDLANAIDQALAVQPVNAAPDTADELFAFHMDRLRGYQAMQGFTAEQFEAVAATGVTDMRDFDRRLRAVADFMQLPAAAIVSGAHKRARNLLRKSHVAANAAVDHALLADGHAQSLATALSEQKKAFDDALAEQDYTRGLSSLATLSEPLDAFFDHVMVMADDKVLRGNRLALLAMLDERCRRIADISRLSTTP